MPTKWSPTTVCLVWSIPRTSCSQRSLFFQRKLMLEPASSSSAKPGFGDRSWHSTAPARAVNSQSRTWHRIVYCLWPAPFWRSCHLQWLPSDRTTVARPGYLPADRWLSRDCCGVDFREYCVFWISPQSQAPHRCCDIVSIPLEWAPRAISARISAIGGGLLDLRNWVCSFSEFSTILASDKSKTALLIQALDMAMVATFVEVLDVRCKSILWPIFSCFCV